MKHFPIFMDVRDRTCVVIGGGAVAVRKVTGLLDAGARVTVVAPKLAPELRRMARDSAITHRDAGFSDRHLDGAILAIAATDDRALNARIARLARLRGLPVNVVDDPALCSFIMPAVIDRSPVTIAVSSGGASPTLSRWIRARIEIALPASIGLLASLASAYRSRVRQRIRSSVERRRFWDDIIEGETGSLALAGRNDEAEAALNFALRNPADGTPGAVYLVGAGPGDPELLTLRALRLLQTADVIVHDALVPGEVLELARRDARRIDAGKRQGRHRMTQEDINALLIRLARRGERVVRLKGGDPFIFGRGGEELEAIVRADVACHVVPGITAAMGCAASAGLPLTHRDHAGELVFLSGYDRSGAAAHDWANLARQGRTLAIYMGRTQLRQIASGLIAGGLPPETRAIVIENGTTARERRISGTLASLPGAVAAAELTGPALIVVGAVAALARPEDTPDRFIEEAAAV